MNLSLNHVLEITKTQEKWAYKTCLEHKGFANKSSAFCLDCGDTFGLEIIKRNRATCPSCGTKLSIEKTKKRTDKQHTFFAIADIVQEFQVIRNFELIAYYKKGEKVRYFLHEILQHWIQPNGKYEMVGRNHNLQGYCDSWSGDWSIRKEGRSYYYRKFEVYPRWYYPKSVFKREYSKYGINYHLQGLTFLEAIKIVPNNPKVETLLKAKQFALAAKGNSWQLSTFWATLKICLRNKYKVKDTSIYFDYLELLKYFNKDLRNAKYVCPKNLNKEHDRLVEKKRAIQKRRKLEKQRKEIAQDQIEYEKLKADFFGLFFTDDEITIKVLENVKEFMEEGDALKHCLFTNKYYNKPDSLILSARIKEKPIETIEVSLSKMKVVQSRGIQNKASEYNKRIVKLVKNNMHTIKSITKKQPKLNQLAS